MCTESQGTVRRRCNKTDGYTVYRREICVLHLGMASPYSIAEPAKKTEDRELGRSICQSISWLVAMTDTDYRQPLFLSGTPRRAAENGGQNPTQKHRLPRVDVEKARTVPFSMPTVPKHTHIAA